MPKPDLYGILGVSTRAAPGEIKRAYRRIAFAMHPDVGERPDPGRFREVHEAYEILSNPDRRRSYDVEISIRRRPLSAEPLRPKVPVTVLDDFLTVRPSIEEMLDHIAQNFFGYREKKWWAPAPARGRGDTGCRGGAVWLPRPSRCARLREVRTMRWHW
jgi:curved DNA-binding protein CbpA